MPVRRVAAILTAHNRRETTLACLRSYFSQDAPGTGLRAIVVDDEARPVVIWVGLETPKQELWMASHA